ncbi:MAG: succinate--CoA ligase subunit alpha [Chloroflexi bacterium]|nr:succinate--CoA ligase subunit alpha [Chloroflexota bacterium]
MAVLVNEATRVLVQGITGREGSFHTAQMLAYGTRVVAGVTPGKGGQVVHGVPVFDDVLTAVRETGANTSIIYVPAPLAVDAILEAAEAPLPLIVCITEGIPVWEMIHVRRYLEGRPVRLIGPNCPGVITPGVAKVGIMPGYIHTPGRVGLVSRSGTLTYEVVWALTQKGIGQSTCLGIGGDPIVGTGFVEILDLFQHDADTDAVVLIGEIGGSAEQQAARFIREKMTKPVVAFVAGRTAPPGRRMGHAGAIISGDSRLASVKIEALRDAGAHIADHPGQVAEVLVALLEQGNG